MVNVEEELAILESMANEKFGAYEEQLETKKKLEAENEEVKSEIFTLKEKLTAEQGDLSTYEEKIAKISTQKADLEVQLAANQEKLAEEERLKAETDSESKDIEKVYDSQIRDYQDLVTKQEKLDNEVSKRDNIIKNLNDDVAAKDEVLSKLNKEKKQKNDTAIEYELCDPGHQFFLTRFLNYLINFVSSCAKFQLSWTKSGHNL